MASASSRPIPKLEAPPLLSLLPTPKMETPTTSAPGRPKLTTTHSRTTSHRLPPPALFQGPPSKNASHASLIPPPGGRTGNDSGGGSGGGADSADERRSMPLPSHVPPASSFSGPARTSLRQPNAQPIDRRAESLWAEMQKTLADVELSAMNTSHVFGASHARALEDLRAAQLGLAQAWARSEAEVLHEFDDAADDSLTIPTSAVKTPATPKSSTLAATSATPASAGVKDGDSAAATAGGGASSAGGGGATTTTTTTATTASSAFTNNRSLEEETERDIQLARKRREANDRYFSQVNKGVVEVVRKLDEVAAAMRRVERESRDIWDESSDGVGDEAVESERESATDGTGLTDSPGAK